jgi:hypothetical protein
MRFRIVSLILLSSTLGGIAPPMASAANASDPPAAANATPPAAAPANAAPPASAKLICRTDDAEETGSHVPHRTCLTQAQWDSLGDDPGPRYVTQVPVVGPTRAGGFGGVSH